MTRIDLNWYQRISLWLRIGSVQAPNMQIASTLYRVIEKIRPSDEEREKSNLVTTPGGYTWMLPSIEYGQREVEIEADEAEQLAAVLENPPQGMGVLVADMAWIMPMIARLKAAAPAKQTVEGELVAAA